MATNRLGLFLLVLVIAACARKESAKQPAVTTSSAAQSESVRATEVGDPMPAYSAKYLDGKTFDVGAEMGNVLLINVWATWCSPCRFEIPELQALHNKYADRGFKVIGVSVDEGGTDAVKQFVDEYKMTYPIVLDPEGHIANVLRTTVLPTSVIVGRSGQIIWRKIGAVMPNETAAVDGVVQQALTPRKSS
jgi:peroxiredoxin